MSRSRMEVAHHNTFPVFASKPTMPAFFPPTFAITFHPRSEESPRRQTILRHAELPHRVDIPNGLPSQDRSRAACLRAEGIHNPSATTGTAEAPRRTRIISVGRGIRVPHCEAPVKSVEGFDHLAIVDARNRIRWFCATTGPLRPAPTLAHTTRGPTRALSFSSGRCRSLPIRSRNCGQSLLQAGTATNSARTTARISLTST